MSASYIYDSAMDTNISFDKYLSKDDKRTLPSNLLRAIKEKDAENKNVSDIKDVVVGVSSDRATGSHREEDIFGLISKSEIDQILSIYDRQQLDQKLIGNPVKCDQVKGGSFAKLLFSKPGFHNPGSTEFLVDRLKIIDRNRESFLGGYSNYSPNNQNSVESMLDSQKRLHIRDEAKRIYKSIEQRKDENQITDAIHKIIKLDGQNGDALAIRGKWSLRCKQYEQAIKDLNAALQIGCWDRLAISEDLSQAYSDVGVSLYAKGNFREASDRFSLALSYNSNNEHARLNLGLCVNKLNHQYRPFGASTSSFGNRRK